ncbi:Ig-like domain-containing protein [Lactococcus petauri]|nr:Ig-like domain-containing protein [Lactococcus petauri]
MNKKLKNTLKLLTVSTMLLGNIQGMSALVSANIKTEGVKQIATKGNDAPIVNRDGTVSFANEIWDVIKDPDQMGVGNYLIAMETSIGSSTFNNLRNGDYYFQENDSSLDGYQSPDNLVKPLVDSWYNSNIAGTDYEQYVQPVVLNNPTLGDLMTPTFGGWFSNTNGSSNSGFLAMNQPNAFSTEVNVMNGEKDAFLMSTSDVSDGQAPSGNLTYSAIKHRDRLMENGILTSWLRSPGSVYRNVSRIDSEETELHSYLVSSNYSVVPSLVITGIGVPNVTISGILGNSIGGYTVTGIASDSATIVTVTDSSGNVLGTEVVNPDGSYSVSISRAVGPEAQINVTATDALGNVSDPALGTTPEDVDLTSVNVKDSTLIVGDTWTLSVRQIRAVIQ